LRSVAGFDMHRRQITFDAVHTETGEESRRRRHHHTPVVVVDGAEYQMSGTADSFGEYLYAVVTGKP